MKNSTKYYKLGFFPLNHVEQFNFKYKPKKKAIFHSGYVFVNDLL